jgi:hypothetical protein
VKNDPAISAGVPQLTILFVVFIEILTWPKACMVNDGPRGREDQVQ